MFSVLSVLSVLSVPAYAATPPTGTSIASQSSVAWADPTWKSDGTGAMPIGNGDMTSSVWVDEGTGDLRLLLSKSDVFDENSQPVKTGVLRLTFDPPLWKAVAPAPAPLKPHCAVASALDNFEKMGGAGKTSTICDQDHLLKDVQMMACGAAGSFNETACAETAARACCATVGCVSFSLNPQAGYGTKRGAEFCASTLTNRAGTPGPGWTSWTMHGVAPPEPGPPPAPPAPSTCAAGAPFCQTLDIATSTVTIKTPTIEVSVFVELNAPLRDGVLHRDAGILHVTAALAAGAGAAEAQTAAGFGLKVVLEPYREEGKDTLGRGYCYPRYEHADTIVSDAKDEMQWYHWNHINTTVRTHVGRLSGLTVFHSKSGLYGASVWARRALNSQQRRLLARAVHERNDEEPGRRPC
jgi:hypothetical protein